VNWSAANPASSLEALCTQLGCRIVGGEFGRVRIVRSGVGNSLPDDDTIENISYSVDPPTLPDSILFVGGKTRFESLWRLQAVGQELDGNIKPIHQLSYAINPAGQGTGFNRESIKGFYNVLKTYGHATQAIAQQTVFKWYQIVDVVDDPWKQELQRLGVPSGTLTRLQAVPSLESGLASFLPFQQGVDEVDQRDIQSPPSVTGLYWPKKSVTDGVTSSEAVAVDTEFSIDGERGIVQFSDAVYKLDAGKENHEADLFLKIAHPILHNKQIHRFSIERKLTNQPQGTGPHVIYRDDVVRVWKAMYTENDDSEWKFSHYEDNLDDVTREANYYIDGFIREIQTESSYTIQYADLKPIPLDGAIQQVGWSVGLDGTTTTASINDQFDLDLPDYYKQRGQNKRQQELDRFSQSINKAFAQGVNAT
jgi:hypothetical protein